MKPQLPVCIKCVYNEGDGLWMNSRDVIRILEANGWYEMNQVGSHKQFKHPTMTGRVTVPHPKRDFPIGTLKSIEKQSGLKFR